MEIILKDTPLFETHFHIPPDVQAEDYKRESIDAGVKYMIAAASNLESTVLSEKFAEQCADTWFSAGVHPHDASNHPDSIQDFAKFAKNRKCVAVGEIGVDYFYNNSEREIQLQVFEQFLELALSHNLPAIIHCRDKDNSEQAYIDTFCLLKEFAGDGGRFVIHCYTGSVGWAERFLKLGGYLGITGIVTFPKAENVRDVLKTIPDDRLLLETDSPYLAPVPKRGKTNHPKYLPYIAQKVAEERGVTLQKIIEQTTANAKKLFNC